MITWTCELCKEDLIGKIVDHFRLMHPDVTVELEFWPDGLPVIYDNPDTENWA